jgi:hypothetical protein
MADTSAGLPWPATDDVPDPLTPEIPDPLIPFELNGEVEDPDELELGYSGAAAERAVDDGQKK